MLTQVDVRRRRIGGIIAALIGVVLIVLAFLAFTGRLGATDKSDGASDAAKSAGATAQSAESSESDSGSSPASGSEAPDDVKLPLIVLNGGGAGGLAAAGQTAFEDGGWEVAEIGNYVGDEQIDQSTVFYSSGDDKAQTAADALAEQFPELVAEQAPSGLGYDGVVVVLTGDWTPGS